MAVCDRCGGTGQTPGMECLSKAFHVLFEVHFEKKLTEASYEWPDVERWLRIGIPCERIMEAIQAMVDARPQPKSRWGAVKALIRDIPDGQPMVWKTGRQ